MLNRVRMPEDLGWNRCIGALPGGRSEARPESFLRSACGSSDAIAIRIVFVSRAGCPAVSGNNLEESAWSRSNCFRRSARFAILPSASAKSHYCNSYLF